ncbi:MAG: alternative oxidase, partial [Hyphococcus sp.]
AVVSYTNYLQEIDNGALENVPAPQIAIEYWNLPEDARLRDVVLAVREDEVGHRDRNHYFANALAAPRRESALAG